MNTLNRIIIFILVILLGQGCCKDCTDDTNPECPNYNPCKNKIETSADFYTEVQEGNRWYEVDVADENATWRFRAKDSTADEYLWEVGADKFTTKSFILSGFPIYKYIPIKLYVKRYKPNNNCFPNDKGVATMTKDIYTESIVNFQYDYNLGTGPKNTILKTIYGKFRGYNKRAPNHIFNFELKPYCCLYQTGQVPSIYGGTNYFDYPNFDVINLPYDGQSLYKSFFESEKYAGVGYSDEVFDGLHTRDGISYGLLSARHIGIWTNESCQNQPCYTLNKVAKYYSFFKSYIYLARNDKDKITVEYWYRDTTTRKIIKDTFIGTRVP